MSLVFATSLVYVIESPADSLTLAPTNLLTPESMAVEFSPDLLINTVIASPPPPRAKSSKSAYFPAGQVYMVPPDVPGPNLCVSEVNNTGVSPPKLAITHLPLTWSVMNYY